ncbi:MAG: hypothetical protein Q4E17_03415 [Synergistes sp.]|nr:hypothetical protein [Synergistes sp.]
MRIPDIRHNIVAALAAIVAGLVVLPSQGYCNDGKIPVKFFILPHFEVGGLSDGHYGETELFYQNFLSDAKQYSLSSGYTLYYGKKHQAAMLLTGQGKVTATMSVTSALCDDRFDFSDALILCVGCAGGSTGRSVFGDVCIVTAAVDFDLGHTADIRDFADKNAPVTWFHDKEFDDTSCVKLDTALSDRIYALVRDTKLRSTEISKKILSHNFKGQSWIDREPAVLKGTAATGDNYWKGIHGHAKAAAIATHYKCTDPYTVTEMEDVAVLNVVKRFGLLKHTAVVRSVVNLDTFISGATPESLWGGSYDYMTGEFNAETLDIFTPAMRNLFDVCKRIINAHIEKSLF